MVLHEVKHIIWRFSMPSTPFFWSCCWGTNFQYFSWKRSCINDIKTIFNDPLSLLLLYVFIFDNRLFRFQTILWVFIALHRSISLLQRTLHNFNHTQLQNPSLIQRNSNFVAAKPFYLLNTLFICFFFIGVLMSRVIVYIWFGT